MFTINKNDRDIIFIKVNGDSMEPIVWSDSVVCVLKQDKYYAGDVILFNYKNEGLLLHRLLKIENNRYYLKGDNSFRVEDISYKNIIGRAIIPNDTHNNKSFVIDSLEMNKVFRNNRFNVEDTKKTLEFTRYYEKYLKMINDKNAKV